MMEDERREAELESALFLALDVLGSFEPTDARAVSDEYVAMAAIACRVESPNAVEIIMSALEARVNPNVEHLKAMLAARGGK